MQGPHRFRAGPPMSARLQELEVGLVDVLLGLVVDLDVGTLVVVLDLEQLAVGPAGHDHVLLGDGIVPVAGEDRPLEVLDQPLELRDVLEAGADLGGSTPSRSMPT